MGRKIKKRFKIEGKIYTFWRSFSTLRAADIDAKNTRGDGWNARVIERRDRKTRKVKYLIYRRRP